MSDEKQKKLISADPVATAAQDLLNMLNQKSIKERAAAKERMNLLRRDRSALERMYSKYLKLDTWLLFTEALPLSIAIDPKDWFMLKGELVGWNRIREFEARAKADAGQSLTLTNPSEKPDKWRVKPKLFLQWMEKAGFQVNPQLASLLHNNEHKKQLDGKLHGNAERFANNRERVLGAAFAIVSKYHKQCVKPSGKVSIAEVIRIMEQKCDLFFEEREVPLASGTLEKLLREWLKRVY